MRKTWKTGLFSLFFLLSIIGLTMIAPPQKALAGSFDNAVTFYNNYGSQIVFKDGYFYYATRGKVASASVNTTHWGTIGYRMRVTTSSRSTFIYFSLSGYTVEKVSQISSGGYEYALCRINLSYVKSKLAQANGTAYNEFTTNGGYIVVDSCMITIKIDKNGNRTNSGSMDDYGNFNGKVYTDYNGIANAASWSDPSSLLSYFNKTINYVSELKSRQIVYVRYQSVDGGYGGYSAVINNDYVYGTTVSWSRGGDDCYNAASISYTATQDKTSYISVTRKQYVQNVYVKYQDANGNYSGDWSLVKSQNLYYGASFAWSYSGDNCYNAASISYTVQQGKTSYIYVNRKQYAQNVYVKYQDTNGNYSGDWTLVKSQNLYYGASFAWSYSGDNCYNAASISYTVQQDKTSYIYVTRKQYLQSVYVKYQDANGNYCGEWALVRSQNLYYGASFAWSYPGDDCYNAASISYTVQQDKTSYIYVIRKQYVQNVYVKYQDANGNYSGEWALVRSQNLYYGAGFEWSYSGDSCYNASAISRYIVTGVNNHYIYISRKKYTVSVSAGTGIDSVTGGGSYFYGASCTVDAAVRIGYTWINWSGTYTYNSKRNSFTVTGNVALTANAEANTYYIVFHPNGGSGSMVTLNCKYDQTYTLPQMSFTPPLRPCKYLGWNPNANSYVASYLERQQIRNLTSIDGYTFYFYAIWDYAPELTGSDRYFTLYEAKTGVITEAELLRTVITADREDGTTQIRVKNYSSAIFTGFTGSGETVITYTTTDSRNNTTEKQARVTIVDTGATKEGPIDFDGRKLNARFINSSYYLKSYENGGLESTSKWKSDIVYRDTLATAMNNVKGEDGNWSHTMQSWEFAKEDIEQVKQYVKDKGMGNSKNNFALEWFLNLFQRCKEQ